MKKTTPSTIVGKLEAEEHISTRLGQSRHLIVAFGSYGGNFTFLESLKRSTADFICLRDSTNGWYMSGADGFSGIAATSDFLRHQMIGYRNTMFLGSSMGAFGALNLARFSAPKNVFCINPQVFIDPERRKRFRDQRWQKDISAVHLSLQQLPAGPIDEIWKLPPNIEVHAAGNDRLDALHAQAFKDHVPEAAVFLHMGYDHHDLPRHLRDSGIISGAIETIADNGQLKNHNPPRRRGLLRRVFGLSRAQAR